MSGTALKSTVAALYVKTDGAYFGLEGVDPWDEKRDAPERLEAKRREMFGYAYEELVRHAEAD